MQQRTLDLTPSPRILRMLGQIDFKPWQCLAELIDNSVDAFVSARGESLGMMFPQVNVEVSSTQEIRGGTGQIKVSDNGPGMTPDFLEKAARAGYSGNSSIDKLGLFGMGFNVATARLGARTEVWTTRVEDDRWWGLRIDFDEMERSDSYVVPPLERPKTAAESQVHGTEVIISKLDPERALYLRSGGGGRATREKLERIYNKIMRDLGLKVIIGTSELATRDFCTWGDNRFVETKTEFGRIPALMPIEEDLGARQYCEDCWAWLLENEKLCPVCQSDEHLRLRERQVKGWIGIQRFFDQNDYGIDLLRNGRVIEERSKGFFSWAHPETGDITHEYPLEQTHWGGRIVGELEVDFVPLASHQKDAFDRNTLEWRLVEKVVRGDGPVLQKVRQQLGMPERNDSPFARLHTGYRRGSPPGLRNLVPGDQNGQGINVEPQRWAAEFWDGNTDYQSDDKWWDAVLVGDEARRKKGKEVPEDLAGPIDLGAGEADEPETDTDRADTPAPPTSTRVEDAALTGTFDLPDIPGSPTLDVTTEQLVDGQFPLGLHIQFTATGSRIDFAYDPRHAFFAGSLLEPVDCLVEELAFQLLQRSGNTQVEWPISRITQLLREKYFRWSVPSYGYIREQAEAFLQEMVEYYTEALSEMAPLDPLDPSTVTEEERGIISRAVARADHAGDDRVREVIESGEFPRYLGASSLPQLVERWPELVCDGKFLTVAYESAEPALRAELLYQVTAPVRDLVWVANPEGNVFYGEEWRNLLGRAASSLRLLQSWKA